MKQQKKFVPNRHVNTIHFRVPQREDIRSTAPIEPHFDSWEQARDWLVRDREERVKAAADKLRLAKATLKRAQSMVSKGFELA